MAITIGSARHDENNAYSGGAAGDQLQTSSTNDTKGEVSMQTMYTHSKGWYILRPKTKAHADALATAMKTACNNANLGYDQGNRLGVITYGIHATTKTECDCSSLVRACIIEATGKDPGNFRTATEVSMLAATGLFEDKIAYVSQSKTPLYNGDILCTKSSGHTVIVVSGNPRTETSSTTALTVDGSIGTKTVKRLQAVLGTTQDGKISGQDKAQKKYWTSIDSAACSWSGGKSQVVKALQKLVGATADGELGKNTATATQEHLIDAGYSCGSAGADGCFGANSAKALQRWLNARPMR